VEVHHSCDESLNWPEILWFSTGLVATREREIVRLLAEGKTNKEVAAELNPSAHTPWNPSRPKLNLHNSAELVLYAAREGIIH
jgi:DNA-binding NarL/FixJ family response regulator